MAASGHWVMLIRSAPGAPVPAGLRARGEPGPVDHDDRAAVARRPRRGSAAARRAADRTLGGVGVGEGDVLRTVVEPVVDRARRAPRCGRSAGRGRRATRGRARGRASRTRTTRPPSAHPPRAVPRGWRGGRPRCGGRRWSVPWRARNATAVPSIVGQRDRRGRWTPGRVDLDGVDHLFQRVEPRSTDHPDRRPLVMLPSAAAWPISASRVGPVGLLGAWRSS